MARVSGSGRLVRCSLALIVAVTVWPGTTRAEIADACPLAAPVSEFSQPPNLHHFKRQLVWYRCTRYEADIAAVIAEAGAWIDQRAGRVTKPAIVLDIDETSLSNWPAIINNDFAYFPDGPCDLEKRGVPCGDNAWHRKAEAPAIAPTRDLYRRLRCLDVPAAGACTKVDVFFITGRRKLIVDQQPAAAWTLRNLVSQGFADASEDRLFLRDPNSHGSASVHKIAARTAIEQQGYTIIANIGDQDSDLSGGHSERTFKLPNPFYWLP